MILLQFDDVEPDASAVDRFAAHAVALACHTVTLAWQLTSVAFTALADVCAVDRFAAHVVALACHADNAAWHTVNDAFTALQLPAAVAKVHDPSSVVAAGR